MQRSAFLQGGQTFSGAKFSSLKLQELCFSEAVLQTIQQNILQVCNMGGPDNSVIITGYGLEGMGIESRWGRYFPHLSRPTLGPTQPPVQWVSGLSRGKERPGRDADPSPLSSAAVKKEQCYISTPPMGRKACTEPQCLYKDALYPFLYYNMDHVTFRVKVLQKLRRFCDKPEGRLQVTVRDKGQNTGCYINLNGSTRIIFFVIVVG